MKKVYFLIVLTLLALSLESSPHSQNKEVNHISLVKADILPPEYYLKDNRTEAEKAQEKRDLTANFLIALAILIIGIVILIIKKVANAHAIREERKIRRIDQGYND